MDFVPTTTIEELLQKVETWGSKKGILTEGTPMGQIAKLVEEAGELIDSINNESRDDIRDAIGDMIVVLTLLGKMYHLTVQECLQHAYNEIQHRTGVMSGGTFIKDDNRGGIPDDKD